MKIKTIKSKSIRKIQNEKKKDSEKIPLFAKKFIENNAIAANAITDIFMTKFVFDSALAKAQQKIRRGMEQDNIELLDDNAYNVLDKDFDIFIRAGLLKIAIKSLLGVNDSEAIDLALSYVLQYSVNPKINNKPTTPLKNDKEALVGILKNLLDKKDKEPPFFVKDKVDNKNGQK